MLSDVVNGMGYTGQGLKIMLEHRGEFLRIEYSSGGCNGYLNRTLPNLVCGEWDLTASATVANKARALWDQLCKIRRRGGVLDACEWWRQLVKTTCGVYMMGALCAPSSAWLHAAAENGGAGVAYPDCPGVYNGYTFDEHQSQPLLTEREAEDLGGAGINNAVTLCTSAYQLRSGAQVRVVRDALIRTAHAKVLPRSAVQRWRVLDGYVWHLRSHQQRTREKAIKLYRDRHWISVAEVYELASRLCASIENSCWLTSVRNCWTQLHPPVLVAVKLGVGASSDQLTGLCELLRGQNLHEVGGRIRQLCTWFDDDAVVAWVYDEYCWGSPNSYGADELDGIYARYLTDWCMQLELTRHPPGVVKMSRAVVQELGARMWNAICLNVRALS
jgi:hypothetical protein